MSHIRGVKLERRVIVPFFAANRTVPRHQYRPFAARATSAGARPSRGKSINRRILNG